MPLNHVAVDIGAGSGRVFAGHLDGEKLVSREIHRFDTSDMILHGRRVLNTFRYYEEVLRGLSIYSKEYGPDLASVGVDSFSSDFTVLDAWGRPVFPVRSYRDSLLASMEPLIEKEYGSYRLYQRNGNHSMLSDTLQQMLRMREERDPSLQHPHGILFVADLMHFLLGGRRCVEHSMASYTRLFNRNTDSWDDEVLDAFGINREIKTDVVRAGETLGIIRCEIAQETGLATGTSIVCPACHDTASAALSIPDTGSDWAFISSGSWSLVGTETDKPVYSEKSWRHNFCNSTMPLMTNMLAKNVTGMWLMQQCRKSWSKFSDLEIVDMAERHPDVDLYIDVERQEFYAPRDMPDAVVGAIKDTYGTAIERNNYGLIARICLQSIAMKYRYYLELLGELSGKTFSRVYLLGGGSKIGFLNKIAASILNLPVYTGIYEGSVTGNLLVQMYGCGEIGSKTDMRQIVKNTFPLTLYSPIENEIWDQKYSVYCKAMGWQCVTPV